MAKPKVLKSPIEWYTINRVREIRMKQGLSQEDIARTLNTSRAFIGKIESPKYPSKYSLNHLNTISKELGCSLKDLMPEKPL